jgi:zinc D-Ala-D-Ala carboxypeptidase
MTPITEHFTLEELTASETAARHGWDNTPGPAELANLGRLARLLEDVRTLLGRPIVISSGYRGKQVNDAVGSKDSSQHRIGCAADIKVPSMTPDEVVRAIRASGIGFDQVIREFDAWTHISVPSLPATPPRAQALIIDKQGTRLFA